MPNWCSNDIIVKGTASEIKKFEDQFNSKHTSYSGATMNNPTEETLKNNNWIEYRETQDHFMGSTSTAYTYISEIEEVEGYSFSNFVEMTKEDFLNGWRDWSSSNWGTKWDLSVSDIHISGLDLVEDALIHDEPDLEIEVVYSFQTAWSPCEPVVEAMSKAFPALMFTHTYEESGMQFAGKVEYTDGEESDREDAEGDDYRRFIVEVLEDEDAYVKCSSCSSYVEDYEVDENDDKCPECESLVDLDSLR